MFDGILLIVATDAPKDALDRVLGVSPAERPAWCMVTSDPKTILQMPANIPCLGFWTRERSAPASAAEVAWDDRRAGGPVAGINAATLERLADWKRRRDEDERKLAYAHLDLASRAERGDAAGAPAGRETVRDGQSTLPGTSVLTPEHADPAWQGKESAALRQTVNARAPDGEQGEKRRASKWR